MLLALGFGFLTGIGLSLTLGTVFFALIQNSIDNGYKSGLLIASGVAISDIWLISLAFIGVSSLPNIPHLSFYASLLGGTLLLVLGGINLVQKSVKTHYPDTHWGSFIYFFLKGVFLNILNPINFILWAGISSKISEYYDFYEQVYYFSGCVLAIFAVESAIAISAHRLKKHFNDRILRYINLISGCVFVGVGCKIIYDALKNY